MCNHLFHYSDSNSSLGDIAPYVLVSYRNHVFENGAVNHNILVDRDDVKRIIQQVFPKNKPILTGAALVSILNAADVYTLAGVLKWCWARLPGGIITWKVYDRFKEEEKRAKSNDWGAFKTIIPRAAESPIHLNIISSFFVLLYKIAARERKNCLSGRKLARFAGFWAFELLDPNKEAPSNFGSGLLCWSRAAEACNHMFHAFLRTMFPRPGEGDVFLPQTLQKLIMSEQYPPKALANTRLVLVPKITLTVGRLSASPFVLLQRVAKTIQFEDHDAFNSEEDYETLFQIFGDVDEIEHNISAESRRILEGISQENSILARDHPLRIKDTLRLPYDVRCKTWSKSYNHAYVDPVTGDLHRPLTNYVYNPGMRDRILQTEAPPSEYPMAPYPTSPTMSNAKPLRADTWAATRKFYQNSTDDPRYQNLDNWNKQRRIAAEHEVSCKLSKIEIDDFFVWVWMSSLSQEQTEVSKALFGRSIVVEVQIAPGSGGRRWVVVEEILNPKPSPMKAKTNVTELPLDNHKRVVSAPIKFPSKPKAEKKPVRFEKPPPSPPPVVKIPEPEPEPEEEFEEEQHIQYHFDNIEPLVAAVVERLKNHNTDHQTQTDVDIGTQSDFPVIGVSQDQGNNKGCQTDDTVLIRHAEPQVTVQHSVVTDIRVSPSLEASTARRPRPSTSYQEVIDAIPYLNMSDDIEEDYAVTPILSSAPYFPQASTKSELALPKKRAPQSPPSNAEHFVVSIDSSHEPTRRVVSMPPHPRSGDMGESYRSLLSEDDDDLLSNHHHSSSGPKRSNTSMNASYRPSARAVDDGLYDQTPRSLPQNASGNFAGPQSGMDSRGRPVRRDGPDTRQAPRNYVDPSIPRGMNKPPFTDGSSGMAQSRNRFDDARGGASGAPPHPPHPYRAVTEIGMSPANATMDHTIVGTTRPLDFPKSRASRGGPPGVSPTTSFREFDYGSDTNYRYDPHERLKDSPDSGYANLPARGSHRQYGATGSNNGSDSDVSRGSIGPSTFGQRPRSNSNLALHHPPSSQHLQNQNPNRVVSNPEKGAVPDAIDNSLSPQFRSPLDFRAPQQRSGAPQPFAESPLKSVVSFVSKPVTPHVVADSQAASIISPSVTSDGHSSIVKLIPTTKQAEVEPSLRSAQSQGSSSKQPLDSKWSEVRSNLSRTSLDRAKPPLPPLPAVIETNPRNPTSAQTLVGTTSPEDYYEATVKTMRRPSINTGDHVKNIVIKDNFNSNVIGKLPTSSQFDDSNKGDLSAPGGSSAAAARKFSGSRGSDIRGGDGDDSDDDDTNDFTTAFLPVQKLPRDMYRVSPPRPKVDPNALPMRTFSSADEPLYQSTQQSLLGGYGLGEHNEMLARENARSDAAQRLGGGGGGDGRSGQSSASRGSAMGGLSGGAPARLTRSMIQSEPRRVSRFSIQGFMDAAKKKKQQQQQQQP